MSFGVVRGWAASVVVPVAFGFLSSSLVACSSADEEREPSTASPVRSPEGQAGSPNVVEPPDGTPEGLDDPGDTKPLVSREAFVDPGPPPATGSGDGGVADAGVGNDGGVSNPPPAPSPYAYLDPNKVIPKNLLDRAVTYFAANKAALPNKNYVTIVDYAVHSGKKRFFVIDMKTGSVRQQVVAHGKMSDPNWTGYATSFSNVNGSNKSSLGFAVTGATYYGAHGRSLRLEGLSTTNSNLYSRAIVVHRADYVAEGLAKQGRSLGCYVLDPDVTDEIIDMIAGGSLLYTELGT